MSKRARRLVGLCSAHASSASGRSSSVIRVNAGVQTRSTSWFADGDDHEAVVRTDREEIRTSRLVVAAGAWTASLLGDHVERELALVKVAGTGDHRIEALRLAEVFRANVVDTTISSFVFEVTGASTKIDRFVELMQDIGLVEVARTGIVAMARGKLAI